MNQDIEFAHVTVRIRPPLDTDNGDEIIKAENEHQISIADKGGHLTYNFESIFGKISTQKHIFKYFSSLLKDASQGLNITVIAYGHIGSGKTYTLIGKPTFKGLIPRTLSMLFKSSRSKSLKIYCSFLHIFNDEFYDLFQNSENTNLIIKENLHGGIIIENLAQFSIFSKEDFKLLWETAENNKSIRENSCKLGNSHVIIQIFLEIDKKGDKNKIITSKLNFCDLGESVLDENDKEKGELLNKSISSLNWVILSLTRRTKSSIFKEKSLAWLLKEYLGMNTRIIFIGTISSNSDYLEKIKATLNLSEKAKLLRSRINVDRIPSFSPLLANNSLEDKTKKLSQVLTKRYGLRHTNSKCQELETLRNQLNRANVSDIEDLIQKNKKLKKSYCLLSGKEDYQLESEFSMNSKELIPVLDLTEKSLIKQTEISSISFISNINIFDQPQINSLSNRPIYPQSISTSSRSKYSYQQLSTEGSQNERMTKTMKKRFEMLYKMGKYKEKKLIEEIKNSEQAKETALVTERKLEAKEIARKRYYEEQKQKLWNCKQIFDTKEPTKKLIKHKTRSRSIISNFTYKKQHIDHIVQYHSKHFKRPSRASKSVDIINMQKIDLFS